MRTFLLSCTPQNMSRFKRMQLGRSDTVHLDSFGVPQTIHAPIAYGAAQMEERDKPRWTKAVSQSSPARIRYSLSTVVTRCSTRMNWGRSFAV